MAPLLFLGFISIIIASGILLPETLGHIVIWVTVAAILSTILTISLKYEDATGTAFYGAALLLWILCLLYFISL